MDLLKKLNNMITAEEFVKSNISCSDRPDFERKCELVIKFAKLHVEAALKAASEKYWETATQGSNSIQGYHNDILNAYPLEIIK